MSKRPHCKRWGFLKAIGGAAVTGTLNGRKGCVIMANKKIDELVKDGFSFAPLSANFTELAILSLRIALDAFSSTYRSVQGKIAFLEEGASDREAYEALHNLSYRQSYAECIVHFQHFAELVCKDFLRQVHPLLSIDATPKPAIYHKLLSGEKVNPEDWEGLKSIEFSEVLKRIQSLLTEGRLPVELNFLSNYIHPLSKLNELRNRIWHRGTYILHYQALDQFIIQYILPFVDSVTSLPEYKDKRRLWKYNNLHCNVDPISVLADSELKTVYDISKAAFVKELMRAAYKNPIKPVPQGFGKSSIVEGNLETRQRAEQLAKARERMGEVWTIRQCLVCGTNSLLLYSVTEMQGEGPEAESVIEFVAGVHCLCCSFSIDNELKNPREYGIATEDYWLII